MAIHQQVAQWFPTLGPRCYWTKHSQEPSQLPILVRISGNTSPRTSGDPWWGTMDVEHHIFPVTDLAKQVVRSVQSALPLGSGGLDGEDTSCYHIFT